MLRRKHARLCIILLSLPFLELTYIGLAALAGGDCSLFQGGVLIALAVVCGGGAVCVRLRLLRCPHCGKGAAVPRWRAGKPHFCPCCGKRFDFDDE